MNEMPDRWIYLKEACKLKGISYNSVARPKDAWRQPNCGVPDGIVNGRKAWRPETVREWILMDDRQLAEKHKELLSAGLGAEIYNAGGVVCHSTNQ